MHINNGETALEKIPVSLYGTKVETAFIDHVASSVTGRFSQVVRAEAEIRSKSLHVTAYFGQLTGRELEIAKACLRVRIRNHATAYAATYAIGRIDSRQLVATISA